MSMKEGACPRCGATGAVRRREGGLSYEGARMLLASGRLGLSAVRHMSYVCTGCGYYENYVADEEKLAQVAERWDPVG